MPYPSAFHTWLTQQTAQEGEIGRLAQHAASRAEWPVELEQKETLRSWLRKNGGQEWVPALAEAWAEFSTAEWSPPARLTEPARQYLAEGLVRTWYELGCPDPATVAHRAEAGELPAQALLALRLCLGLEAPANPMRALEIWNEIAAAGFTPGFLMAARLFSVLGRNMATLIHMESGARQGELGCLRWLAESEQIGRTFGERTMTMESEELETLWHTHLGDTGEREFLGAEAISDRGVADAECLPLYEAAATKGWAPAFRPLIRALQAVGREAECDLWMTRGVEARDPECLGYAGSKEGDRLMQEGHTTPSLAGAAAVAFTEAAAAQGAWDFFFPLVLFYTRGLFVAADAEQAGLYFAAATLALRGESNEAERLRELKNMAKGGVAPKPDYEKAARWMLEMPRQHPGTRSWWLAARLWLHQGLNPAPPV